MPFFLKVPEHISMPTFVDVLIGYVLKLRIASVPMYSQQLQKEFKSERCA